MNQRSFSEKLGYETILGIFFAIIAIATFFLIEMTGGSNQKWKKQGLTLRGEFSDIKELKAGDPVKMAGVVVGAVESIQLNDQKAEVIMRVDPAQPIKQDSHATISFTGLLGQNYVSLTFGTANGSRAQEGDLLPSDDQADLSTLMAKLEGVAENVSSLLSDFKGDGLSNAFAPVKELVDTNGPKITRIVDNLDRISSEIAQGNGTVGKLVMSDDLHVSAKETIETLRNSAKQIGNTLDMAQSVVRKIEQGEGTLGKLSQDPKLYDEASVAMTNLKEVLQKVNRGEGSVGLLINEKQLYNNANTTLQKVNRAAETLEDQGPLSILGMAVNQLF